MCVLSPSIDSAFAAFCKFHEVLWEHREFTFDGFFLILFLRGRSASDISTGSIVLHMAPHKMSC